MPETFISFPRVRILPRDRERAPKLPGPCINDSAQKKSNNKKKEESPNSGIIQRPAVMTLQESETVEFKESFDRDAVVTAGAFANTRGGTVFIGITDRGKCGRDADRYRIFQGLGQHHLPEHRTPTDPGYRDTIPRW